MVRSRKSEPPPDALFRELMSGVQPLPDSNKAELPRALPRPVRRPRLAESNTADSLSDHIAWQADESTATSYARAGLQRQTVRRLKRGHWKIAAELDLHGCTSDEARVRVAAFLDRAATNGARCVRIIHGKGMSSGGEPVLKRKVAAWLTQRADVLAYSEAHPAEGGAGAVVVLLRAATQA